MRKLGLLLASCVSFILIASVVMAFPLDLSSFTSDPGVSESGGIVTFTENDLAAIYFANDHLGIGSNATTLSFDFSFTPGVNDHNDYLVYELNHIQTMLTDVAGIGHSSIDLTAFRGSEISLVWGLIWGGDDSSTSVATVSNIAVGSDAAPVPEPSTIVLLGGGIVGLLGIGRKKKLRL